MEDFLRDILQTLSNFIKHGRGIDKGFGAILLFLLFIAYLMLNIPTNPDNKAFYLILVGILALFAFTIYAVKKRTNTTIKESKQDFEEGLITEKSYKEIIKEEN